VEQLQLDDFLMYNFLSQVQISPDGKKVAYVATTPDLAKNGYNANSTASMPKAAKMPV